MRLHAASSPLMSWLLLSLHDLRLMHAYAVNLWSIMDKILFSEVHRGTNLIYLSLQCLLSHKLSWCERASQQCMP